MKKGPTYLVDSDVLITAKNRYYSFDLCPGFWVSLLHHHGNGRVFSVDRVRGELLAGRKNDDLVEWVKQVPRGFFLPVDSEQVTDAYEEVMLWANRHPQYTDPARAKFATGADGWLVAYAHIHGAVVVTNEQSAPESKAAIMLPDVCEQFAVRPADTFEMLRELQVRFHWADESHHR